MNDSPLPERELRILEERAQKLARPKVVVDDSAVAWAVSIQAGGEKYLLRSSEVVATAHLAGLSPVPFAPPEVLGVIQHAGEFLALVDLGALLHSCLPTEPLHYLVIGEGEGMVALAVDAIEGFVTTSATLQAPPDQLAVEVRGLLAGLDPEGRVVLDGRALQIRIGVVEGRKER